MDRQNKTPQTPREALKKIVLSSPVLLFPLRLRAIMSYRTPRFGQMLSWLFSSRETGNFTYDLTDSNCLELGYCVSAATGKPLDEIMGYINELRNDSALKTHVISSTSKSRFRAESDNRCDFGRRLGWYAFVRAMKPKVVIETGIDKGLGACCLCAALLKNKAEGFEGRYYGTDINPDAGWLLTAPYSEVGQIIFGDSIESLKKFEPKIDLFINDSDHSGEYEGREYEVIVSKLAPGGIVLGDNAHTTDELVKFSKKYKRQFLLFREEPLGHWYPGAGIGISY